MALGHELGAGEEFAACVRQGTHDGDVTALTQRAIEHAPSGERGFGTPTVTVDGQLVDLGNRDWLADALAAPR